MRSELNLSALLALGAGLILSAAAAVAAEPSLSAVKPTIAKQCTLCHTAEPGAVRGTFDVVTFKAKTIQVKIDDAVEQFKFDEDEIKVVNGAGKSGDGEFLKDSLVKKGHEVKVEYSEKNGIKTAVKLTVKPPVKISAEMLMTTADVEQLVVLGPEKGKYLLIDSRPLPRFQEGAIPTAINLPYPAFDKLANTLLPKDKNAQIIFYCAGVTCNMSPGSADKARKLGYTNLKVYKDGMPAWFEKNHGALSPQFLKEAWIGKGIPHVLLDVRADKKAASGFIKGAVAFPAAKAEKRVNTLKIRKTAPIMIYDQKGGGDAEKAAKALLKGGFKRVVVLTGGFDAWQAAGFDVAHGRLAADVTYVAKPRPGEINPDEFRKYAAELPADVVIIDVRSRVEGKAGMIKGARLIPAEEIKDRLAEIPRDKMIVLYCNTGVIADVAYNTLKELGYTNVRFLNAKTEFDRNGGYRVSKE